MVGSAGSLSSIDTTGQELKICGPQLFLNFDPNQHFRLMGVAVQLLYVTLVVIESGHGILLGTLDLKFIYNQMNKF